MSKSVTGLRRDQLGDHIRQSDHAVGAIEGAAGHDDVVALGGEHREVVVAEQCCRKGIVTARTDALPGETGDHGAGLGMGFADPAGLQQHLEAQPRDVERAEAVLDRPAAGQVRLLQDAHRLALLDDVGLAGRQRHEVGIEARSGLGIDPGVDQKPSHRAVRKAHGVAPTRVVERRRDGPVFQALTSSRWNTM